jgi:uncharacterized membrane protein
MTDQQIYSVVTAIVFAFVAFAHVWRLMNGIAVSVAGTPVPDWVSWVGLIVTGLLAVFGIWLAFEKPKVP